MPSKPPERLTIDRMRTPIGEATFLTDEAGVLRAFDFADHDPRTRRLVRLHYGEVPLVEGHAPTDVRSAFLAYFAGELGALARVHCRTAGTEFQRQVWRALMDIPAGTTWSYARLAAHIGKPKAMRAVGLANGANPVAILVPCHRVIGADGSLTGYGGGIERKRWLLRHEGAAFREDALPLAAAGGW